MRGDPDHISNDARQLLQSDAARELRERMEKAAAARVRATSTNNAEDCRGAVAQFQAVAALWDGLERMVSEQDVRDIGAQREVV